MSKITFTEEQYKSIYTRNKNILLSAAAGSGKTAVLVERIMQLVLDANNPIDIDKILVVTFTDAAAGEMKERIAIAIEKEVHKNPSNQYLQNQLLLLDKSYITTIHSFCSKILRKNYHLIDIDPNFRIGEANEIKLIKIDILNKIFEEEYILPENDVFYELIEMYGDKFSDESLKKMILEIHEFIMSYPWPKIWLDNHVQKFKNLETKNIKDTDWFSILKEHAKLIISGLKDELMLAIDICNLPEGPHKYIESLENDFTILEKIENNLDLDLQNLKLEFSSIQHKKLPTYKKNDIDINHDLKDDVKNIRNNIKKYIKKIKETIFFQPIKYMKSDLENSYKTLNKLNSLLNKFIDNYNIEKNEKNILDFNDLEHLTLKLLLDENSTEENIIKTKLSKEYTDKFYEVMVDEYQDSNLIQELILQSISKDNNRFMVGDVKQSIYKFRQAKPEIFTDKYNRFAYDQDKNIKIDLSKNFRSTSEILNICNLIFKQLMSTQIGNIDYNDRVKLYKGSIYDNKKLSEIHLIETSGTETTNDELKELSSTEIEARYIGEKIKSIIYGKEKIIDKVTNKERDINYSDIVIISRSLSNNINILIEVLQNMDIPAYSNLNTGFFDSIEIMTIISLIQIIDNPLQDIHVITVLHSIIYKINSDELISIRHTSKKNSFYHCINEYVQIGDNEELKEKLKIFLEHLNHWKQLSSYTKVSKLINDILTKTDFYNSVGVMVEGRIKQGNLLLLIEKAIEFENSSFYGLFNFIKYVEKIQKTKLQSNKVSMLTENSNVVRIMTIHKSKGLEFPVVFFSFLGKEINKKDGYKNLLLHQELGFGPIYIDIEKRIKRDTLARKALATKIHLENTSEELRAMYVGITRAKEKLILTGCIKNIDKKVKDIKSILMSKKSKISPYYILKSKTYIDLILPCILRNKNSTEFLKQYDIENIHINEKVFKEDVGFKIIKKALEEISHIKKENTGIDIKKSLDNLKDTKISKELIDKFNYKYPYEILDTIPDKITVSEIKRFYQNHIFDTQENLIYKENILKLPSFYIGKDENYNLRYGSIIHKVLEFIDINTHKTEEKIKELLKTLVDKAIITNEESLFVPIKKFTKFANSSLASRLQKSNKIYKEKPFVIGLTPYEIYRDDNLKHIKKKIVVNGIIDCYFYEDNKIVLIDYKTDNYTNEDEILNKYIVQLELYKKVLERNTKSKVKESILYMFSTCEMITI